jgi:hypothetical protein
VEWTNEAKSKHRDLGRKIQRKDKTKHNDMNHQTDMRTLQENLAKLSADYSKKQPDRDLKKIAQQYLDDAILAAKDKRTKDMTSSTVQWQTILDLIKESEPDKSNPNYRIPIFCEHCQGLLRGEHQKPMPDLKEVAARYLARGYDYQKRGENDMAAMMALKVETIEKLIS